MPVPPGNNGTALMTRPTGTSSQWSANDGSGLLVEPSHSALSASAASAAAPAISQVLVYVVMAGVLVWRPTGLFGQRT